MLKVVTTKALNQTSNIELFVQVYYPKINLKMMGINRKMFHIALIVKLYSNMFT